MQQRSAAFALVENVFAQRAAGGVQPRLRVTYRDVGNRKTDANVREVIVTTTGYRDTLQMARLSEGVYEQAAEKPYPLAGLYTITLVGISAVNTEVNYTDGGSTGSPTAGLAARFEIRPETAATVQFTNVYPVITAGGLQNRVRATFRDAYTNLTDSLSAAQQEIWYSTSTDATAEAPITGTMLTSRISAGVYQADTLRHTVAGLYSFAVVGVSVTTGTQSFTVQPAADFAAEFAGLTTATIAGEAIPGFTVTYRDKQGNLTDNSLGRITYVRAGGSSTATVQALRLSEGVYAVQSTTVTLAGTYTFSVAGIVAANQTGNRVMTLSAAAPTTADFAISTGNMTPVGAKVTLTVRYKDQFNNLTDAATGLTLDNAEVSSTATVGTVKKSVGVYSAVATVMEPGTYLVSLSDVTPQMELTGVTEFSVNPGRAVRGVFSGVPLQPRVTDTVRGAIVKMYDIKNNPTNVWAAQMLELRNVKAGQEYFKSLMPVTQRDTQTVFHSGIFDVPELTFDETGRHTLYVQGDVTDYLRGTGTSTATVIAGRAVSAEIRLNAVDTTIIAGTTVIDTVRFRDTMGNLTSAVDSIIIRNSGNLPVDTLRLTKRLDANNEPYYTTSMRVTVAGWYYFRLHSISDTISGVRSFTIVPAAVKTATLSGVIDTIEVNTAQAAFTLTYRDVYGNLSNTGIGAVQYRHSSGTPSGTITMTMQSFGVYQAAATIFSTAGRHTITALNESAQTLGSRVFTVVNTPIVVPLSAKTASFTNVQDTVIVGQAQQAFTITYRDSTGALTENGIGIVQYRMGNGAAISIPIQVVSTGVRQIVSALNISIAGVYTIEALNGSGQVISSKTFYGIAPPPASVQLQVSPASLAFGTVKVGGISASKNLTITISGVTSPPALLNIRMPRGYGINIPASVFQSVSDTLVIMNINQDTTVVLPVQCSPPESTSYPDTLRLSLGMATGLCAVTGTGENAGVAVRAVIHGVVPEMFPTDTIPSFSVRFYDAANNLTSSLGGQPNPHVRYQSATHTDSIPLQFVPGQQGKYTTKLRTAAQAGRFILSMAYSSISVDTVVSTLRFFVVRSAPVIRAAHKMMINGWSNAVGMNQILENGLDFGRLSLGQVVKAQPVSFILDTLQYAKDTAKVALRITKIPPRTEVALSEAGPYFSAAPVVIPKQHITFQDFKISSGVRAVVRVYIRVQSGAEDILNNSCIVEMQAMGVTSMDTVPVKARWVRGALQTNVRKVILPDMYAVGDTAKETITVSPTLIDTLTVTAPSGFLVSTPSNPTPQQQFTTLTNGVSTIPLTIYAVADARVPYFGQVRIDGGGTRQYLTVSATRFEAATYTDSIPKVSWLVLHSPGAVTTLANREQTCDSNVAVYKNYRTVAEYVAHGIDYSNFANRNSGAQIRFSLDPVIKAGGSTVTVGGKTGILPVIADNEKTSNFIWNQTEGTYTRVRDSLSKNTSMLHQYRDSIGSDIVVYLGTVADPKRDGEWSGIAGDIGIKSKDTTAFFGLDVKRTGPETVWAHEAGHLFGGQHHDDEHSYNFPKTYKGSLTRMYFSQRQDCDLFVGYPLIERTIMAQGGPRIPYWSNPGLVYNSPAFAQETLTSSYENETACMNSESPVGGKFVARFFREPADSYISGRSMLKQGDTAVMRLRVMRSSATMVQWYVKPRFAQMPETTPIGTGEVLTFTMPNASEGTLLLRAMMTDTAGRTITAEREIICTDCPASVGKPGSGMIAGLEQTMEEEIFAGTVNSGLCGMPNAVQQQVMAKQTQWDEQPIMTSQNQENTLLTSPATIKLQPIRPNPAGTECVVSWEQALQGKVHISLYDMYGRESLAITNADYNSGRHDITVLLSGIKPGVYVCRMSFNGAIQTQPLIVIR